VIKNYAGVVFVWFTKLQKGRSQGSDVYGLIGAIFGVGRRDHITLSYVAY